MSIYELAALAAAMTWAFSAVIAAGPSAELGAIAFNRVRMGIVFVMLALYIAVSGGWQSIQAEHVVPLLLSGFIGIFLGDTCLFVTMNRLGPRRTNILFSTNAPMSAILGWMFLGETIVAQKILGIAVVFAGVVLAIVFGKRRSQLDTWESVKGSFAVGITLGLLAALCQSVGSLIARPVMETGVDPATASALRVGVSVLCLSLLMATGIRQVQPKAKLTMKTAVIIGISGIAAMGIGMTLVLFGLSGGKVGIVATLSATTPAWILPLIWLKTRERPAAMAWIGSGLVIAGSGLIFAA
ncbi:DMT family transporter [Oricola thermophila]|uniref:DMT family transporter n=1 Tax=Oricola thermophila TaxID=2742145 RepID=A0A6N1VCV8_9HYPH|nr:DMT family transporter [Oricola thermophila]QKV17405.1 DMT family transporter [Oricola thermophila]